MTGDAGVDGGPFVIDVDEPGPTHGTGLSAHGGGSVPQPLAMGVGPGPARPGSFPTALPPALPPMWSSVLSAGCAAPGPRMSAAPPLNMNAGFMQPSMQAPMTLDPAFGLQQLMSNGMMMPVPNIPNMPTPGMSSVPLRQPGAVPVPLPGTMPIPGQDTMSVQALGTLSMPMQYFMAMQPSMNQLGAAQSELTHLYAHAPEMGGLLNATGPGATRLQEEMGAVATAAAQFGEKNVNAEEDASYQRRGFRAPKRPVGFNSRQEQQGQPHFNREDGNGRDTGAKRFRADRGRDRSGARGKSGKPQRQEEEPVDIGDNYLMKLNELCQKGVAKLKPPQYDYEHVISRPGAPARWECTVSTEAKGPGDDEAEPVSAKVHARNKKEARRLAARDLLALLLKRNVVTQEVVDTGGACLEDGDGMGEDGEPAVSAQSPEVIVAVSVINQLWQKQKFACKPKWTMGPTGVHGKWKCELLIKTEEFGDLEFVSSSPQKKVARQLTAYAAVKRLRELDYPGLEDVHVLGKNNGIVSTEAPETDSEEESRKARKKGDDEKDRSTKPPVPIDEASNVAHLPFSMPETHYGTEFMLPETVSVVLAKTSSECNEWVAKHVSEGTTLAVYIDSRDMRMLFASDARRAGVDTTSDAFVTCECRAVCLATSTSVLFISEKLMGKDVAPTTRVNVPQVGTVDVVESQDGGARQAGQSRTGPSLFQGTSWIPGSVRFLLERSEQEKYGVAVEEGVLSLLLCHGISCKGVVDLSGMSGAVNGLPTNSRRILSDVGELVQDWLSQQFDAFAPETTKHAPQWAAFLEGTGDVLAPAVPAAFACRLVQSRVVEIAESRRRKRYLNAEEYTELCTRLCTRPSRMDKADR